MSAYLRGRWLANFQWVSVIHIWTIEFLERTLGFLLKTEGHYELLCYQQYDLMCDFNMLISKANVFQRIALVVQWVNLLKPNPSLI
jgi:hypothetical protein